MGNCERPKKPALNRVIRKSKIEICFIVFLIILNILHYEKYNKVHDKCFKSIVIDDKKIFPKLTVFFLLYIWLLFSVIDFDPGITLKRAGGADLPPQEFF